MTYPPIMQRLATDCHSGQNQFSVLKLSTYSSTPGSRFPFAGLAFFLPFVFPDS